MAKEIVFQGKTLQEWMRLLEHRNRHVREIAAVALGEIGPPARAAVPLLSRMLLGRPELARPGDLAMADILREAMRDKSPDVRAAAAYALGEIGPKRIAAPLLEAALTDLNHKVGLATLIALKRVRGELRGEKGRLQSWEAFISRKRDQGWKGW